MDKIVLKYQSSKNEITEREISSVSSKIAENMHKIISAYCHLRETVRSFNLDNVIEITINGKIIDKEIFWKNNLNDKNNLIKELDKMLKKKKKEYDEYVLFVETMKKIISEI
jgi:predicted DNA-binding transcriptional regulator YafY